MAIRVKTKWHRSKRAGSAHGGGPKSLQDMASVVAFNLWKVAQEAFRRMEKEGFRFAQDAQVTNFITEFIAFLVHIADRMMYGRVDDTQRAELINAIAGQLAHTMAENQQELLGPGNYVAAFIQTMNERFDQYSECAFSADSGPSYEFTRFLARKISDIMALSDERWVLEQVMDIEAPQAVHTVKRMVQDVLGIKAAAQTP